MEIIFEHFKMEKCGYCNKSLDKGLLCSEWDDNLPLTHHYKQIICGCGKKNWVKVNFMGSGHDQTFKNFLSPLESAINKVREKIE